jgi:predicted transposase YbfD/YdcC
LAVRSNQKTLYRQIGCQFEGRGKIPFTATDVEKRHGRQTRWQLRAKEAPKHIKANWQGSAWIVELITSNTDRKGKRDIACHRFITRLPTTPEALLRLIRQRWSIENEWHWVPDTELGEDAHRYANRTGAAVFSFLRTVVMNLLRHGGYRSIRQGFRELAYNIKGILALGGVQLAGAITEGLLGSPVNDLSSNGLEPCSSCGGYLIAQRRET